MDKNRNLLLVDDEQRITTSLKRMLRNEPFVIYTAASGKEGLEIMKEQEIGVVLSDLMMPEMDGLRFFEKMKQNYTDTVQILLTAHATLDNTLAAINRLQLFGYLTKPWTMDELTNTLSKAFEHYNLIKENKHLHDLTQKQNHELKEINEHLEDLVRRRTLLLEEALNEGILMLATAAEEKDRDTGEHIYRIMSLTIDICRNIGLSKAKTERISTFSIIHDIGKIHIPDDILNKPGPLNEKEWEIMKTHTTAGEKILGVKPFYQIAREIARSHHENWDGSGYPDKLKGNDIPLSARIVAVADVYDALTNKRPYKEAWTRDKAITEMKNLAGIKFDPEVLDAFFKIGSK